MIENIINGDLFLIVFSGVVIFVAQRLISDLWITPNIEFEKCLGKIDTLLIKYEFLCGYEFGSNDGANDEDVRFFKKELRFIASDIVGKFRALFFAERCWVKRIRRLNVNQAKPELLILSGIVSTKNDVIKEVPRAKISIKNIRTYLKLEPFEIDYGKL